MVDMKEMNNMAEWSWKRFGYSTVFIAIIVFFLYMTWEDKKFQQGHTIKLEQIVQNNIVMTAKTGEQVVKIEEKVDTNVRSIRVNQEDIKRISRDVFEVKVKLDHIENK